MIENARIKKNLTQEEICEKLGITQGYYSKLENKTFTYPSFRVLRKLSDLLEIEFNDLASWFSK